MKALWGYSRLAFLGLLVASAFGCDELPAGTALWIRLTRPVSSFGAHRGDPVSAILTEDVECGDAIVFPAASRLEGSVVQVQKVGWGIRHETATLQIAFNRITSTSNSVAQVHAVVAEVENARERVKNGVIYGIRSTDTPQGRITSRYKHLPTWNPYSDVGLIAFKVGFPIFPEPEIYYGPGTDLRLRLAEPLASPPMAAIAAEIPGFREDEVPSLAHLVASLPERSTTTAKADADLVNLVFLGSREQVEAAFQAAGWNPSDAVSRHAFFLNFYAFLDDSSYARAPMRTLLIEGAPSDMNWQRNLNSYAKRDHLRMWHWKESWSGETVWMGASTRDTSATLSLKYHGFLHHIGADLDAERAKVLRDLTIAGCVTQMDYLQRPGVPHITQNATGDPMRTDGAVAVVRLQDCRPPVPFGHTTLSSSQFHAGSHLFRFARRQILTFRSDIWRANVIYGSYNLGSMTVASLRKRVHPAAPVAVADAGVTIPRRRIVAVAETQDAGPKAASVASQDAADMNPR